jgi:hypothetical protein
MSTNHAIAGAVIIAFGLACHAPAEGKASALSKLLGVGTVASAARAATATPLYCLRKVQSSKCLRSFSTLTQAEDAISPMKLRRTHDPNIFEVINAAHQVVEIIQFLRE